MTIVKVMFKEVKEVGIPLDVSSSGSAQILFFVPRDTLPHMDKKSTSTYFFQKKPRLIICETWPSFL